MLKSELQKYAAPVLDEDFTNIVVSAVRYALPRHSYMPSLTRGYLKRHWPHLAKMHWCILRDIREHYADVLNIYADHKYLIEAYDLNEWVRFYNYLLEREDTTLEPHARKEHTPLNPILNLIASYLGAALGCFTAEFYLIPYLKKKINK